MLTCPRATMPWQVLPLGLVLHCALSFVCAHHMQMQHLGMLKKNVTVPSVSDALNATSQHAPVALALAQLIGSVVFATCFILGSKFKRKQRKDEVGHRFAGTVPTRSTIGDTIVGVGDTIAGVSDTIAGGVGDTITGISEGISDGISPSRTGKRQSAESAAAARDEDPATDMERGDGGEVPFRELDLHGANPQLYLPPLTVALLKGMRDRDSSQAYRDRTRRAHGTAMATNSTNRVSV
jgi:hypothetical protein